MSDSPITHSESVGRSCLQVAGRFAAWIAVGALGLVVISILAVHAPGRVKLIGLFAVVVGIASGYLLGQMARKIRLPWPKVVSAISLVLIAAAQVGTLEASYREWKTRELAEMQSEAQEKLKAHLLAAGGVDLFTPNLTSYERYFLHRFSVLKQFSFRPLQAAAEWPRSILAIEILLASVGGAWMAGRMVRQPYCRTCDSWHQSQRSVLVDSVIGNPILELLAVDRAALVPAGSLIAIEYISCRCAGMIPEVRCAVERPGQSRQELVNVRPNEEAFVQIEALMDGCSHEV